MKKAALRKKYLEKRRTLSRDEVLTLSEAVFRNFITHFKFSAGQKIHIFLSIAKFNEVNTALFLDYFRNNGIRIFVPKVVGNKLISVEITQSTPFETSKWGIDEPVGNTDAGISDYDYVITPLLYCDRSGNRVGYGKGFYDGFFSTVLPTVRKIGIGFFSPQEPVEDTDEFDVPLDYLVTPVEILSFSGLE